MRFRDLLRDINRHEQKLENVLLYVDFIDHELPVILLKDGSLVTLFQLAGLDYEGLSEEEKEQFSHFVRVALERHEDILRKFGVPFDRSVDLRRLARVTPSSPNVSTVFEPRLVAGAE